MVTDNWINRRLLTDADAIYDDEGNKIHDLISCEQGDGVVVDESTHPILYSKGVTTVPNMTRPTNSPVGYKIIADATEELTEPLLSDLWNIHESATWEGDVASFPSGSLSEAMTTKAPEGITGITGKKAEIDIIVDSGSFGDYNNFQIETHTVIGDQASAWFHFRGSELLIGSDLNSTPWEDVGVLQSGGSYKFTLTHTNALNGDISRIDIGQEMEYFPYKISAIRFV